MNDVHYTSKSNEWSTPQDLFDRLNAEFHFTLDAAAIESNAKCDRYFTFHDNGLAQSFEGERVWLNPPYGRDLGRWVKKAVSEPSEVTVLLVPARTDTKWWGLFWDFERHKPFDGFEVRFLKGRLKFGGGGKQTLRFRQRSSLLKDAPFPCAIVIIKNLGENL